MNSSYEALNKGGTKFQGAAKRGLVEGEGFKNGTSQICNKPSIGLLQVHNLLSSQSTPFIPAKKKEGFLGFLLQIHFTPTLMPMQIILISNIAFSFEEH